MNSMKIIVVGVLACVLVAALPQTGKHISELLDQPAHAHSLCSSRKAVA